jgi:hypothetical protein
MSLDEFDLFLTYLYLFSNKCVKYKLSFFRIFLMYRHKPHGHNITSTAIRYEPKISVKNVVKLPLLKPWK